MVFSLVSAKLVSGETRGFGLETGRYTMAGTAFTTTDTPLMEHGLTRSTGGHSEGTGHSDRDNVATHTYSFVSV